MAEPVDRVMASQRGVGAVTLSKEAAMVLAMNDAAAHRGNGMFFYLPDTENASNGSSRVLEVRSIVPNLLYVQHSWDETECRTFKQLGEAGRYLFTQGKLPQLGNIDIVPIHLVVHSPFVEAFSWPMNNIATIAIYQRDSRFRLSLMADWARIAVVFVRSNGLNAYSIPIYATKKSKGDKREVFEKTAESMGRIIDGVNDVPHQLKKMCRPWHAGENMHHSVTITLLNDSLVRESRPPSTQRPTVQRQAIQEPPSPQPVIQHFTNYHPTLQPSAMQSNPFQYPTAHHPTIQDSSIHHPPIHHPTYQQSSIWKPVMQHTTNQDLTISRPSTPPNRHRDSGINATPFSGSKTELSLSKEDQPSAPSSRRPHDGHKEYFQRLLTPQMSSPPSSSRRDVREPRSRIEESPTKKRRMEPVVTIEDD